MIPSPTLLCAGAAGEVTGSANLIDTGRAKVLVDFGLFQGGHSQEERNAEHPGFDAREVDAVILTHAHMDHCGRMGRLGKLGCHAGIWCTEPTAEVIARVLRSSASLQRLRVEEHASGTVPSMRVLAPASMATGELGRTTVPPILHSEAEAKSTAGQVRSCGYGESCPIAEGVNATFLDASHVIGSASVLLEWGRGSSRRRLLCSGDIGPARSPLLRAHGLPAEPVETLLMESTNGGRDGGGAGGPMVRAVKPRVDGATAVADGPSESFAEYLCKAVASGRRLLFPAFALGRMQLLLSWIASAVREGAVPAFPVFVDSAMAARICDLYARHGHLLDPAPARLCARGETPFGFEGMRLLRSRRESEGAIAQAGASALMAGSGFCDAGPVLRHLARMLGDEDCDIVFTGHQIAGTLGHALSHGASRIELHEQQIAVRAQVRVVSGFSGHAFHGDLLNWAQQRVIPGGRVILNHGSPAARDSFAATLRSHGYRVDLPQPGEAISI